jgi:hypothetical protein
MGSEFATAANMRSFVFAFHVSGTLGCRCLKGCYTREPSHKSPTVAPRLALSQSESLGTRYNNRAFAPPTLQPINALNAVETKM